MDPTGSTTATTATFPLDLRIDATRFDPLVLDLDGDGIDFTSVTADGSSGITIDHDNDNSTAEIKSSWLNSSSTDDYFVVYSNDGVSFTLLTEFYQINASDAGSGFEALASLDVDNSGVISGSERDSLYLWQDSNGDGNFDGWTFSLQHT